MSKRNITAFILFGLLTSQFAFIRNASAQVRAVNDYGVLGIGRLLKRLNNTASVMMIGAHPDDEDSSLLAYLARGENARTAYLSLTRGDGGQNIIGPELFESLGVIRTEELLQARRLDGAEQYFTRAFDYGFSKTLDEAKAKWDEKIILCDAVTAIRAFRPLVVIGRFGATPAPTHGQHQYAGYIALPAVKAAADGNQCRDSGPAWQVQKFYREIGGQPTLRVNAGQFDPLYGRSYAEIAIEGRSLHRSQGEGRVEPRGAVNAGLTYIEGTVPKGANETSIFDGIDTSLSGIAKTFRNGNESVGDAVVQQLQTAQKYAEQASKEFDIKDVAKILPALAAGHQILSQVSTRNLASANRNPSSNGAVLNELEVMRAAAIQRELFADTIRKVIGLQIEALSDTETVVAGEQLTATVQVYFPKDARVSVKKIDILKPQGWTVAPADEQQNQNPGGPARQDNTNAAARFRIGVPKNAQATQPYWLNAPREGDIFRWPKTDSQSRPFDPPEITATVQMDVNGTAVVFEQPVQFRTADPARGELRRDVNVVPSLSVSVDPPLLVVPLSDKPQTRKLTMSITNNSATPVRGIAGLNINGDSDWKYTFSNNAFELKTRGEKTAIQVDITIPAKTKAGSYAIFPNAMVGESLASNTMNVVAYPHIQTHRYYTKAETKVDVLDLKVAPVRVGYLMGSGDAVPEALRQMGLSVTLLDEDALTSGDLSKFDTIVVGIRASETRPDFVANNKRLLEFVNAGGTLITQYQRGNFANRSLTPFPVDTTDRQGTAAGSIARVVDENAPVKILEPGHAAFNFPNKISDVDFKGWVQERNAYNLVTFDPQYTPLLESHDVGEQENKGGLVIAKVGKGNYIYCSYSFFRQLPEGVPGAYRLFANLVSLPKAK